MITLVLLVVALVLLGISLIGRARAVLDEMIASMEAEPQTGSTPCTTEQSAAPRVLERHRRERAPRGATDCNSAPG